MSTTNNNFIDSPPRPHHETIPITVHQRHAVTSNLGKDTIRYKNLTKDIAFDFLDHALECDHCALRINKIIKRKVQN